MIIRPDVFGIGTLDKVNVPDIVKLGEEAAEEELDNLRKAVRWDNKLRKLFSSN